MVLARLLTPEEIGIYTVGVAVVGLSHIFRDFGVNQYLIQEKNLTKEKVASALGITLLFAWSMGVVLYLCAPQLAAFYETDSVKDVLYVVGLNFFIIPLGAMGPALLKRSMSFGTLMKINLGTALFRNAVSVSLATLGFGFISMAWGSVAGVLISALLAQYYLPRKYRVWPGFSRVKPILAFGGHVIGAQVATEVNSKGMDLLVGKVLGFHALGLLSRAQGFTKIYSNIVDKAINPVLSAQIAMIHRGSGEIAEIYCKALNFITLIAWFSLGFLGLMSFSLIRLLYGEQWDAAVPLASLLCVLGCFGVISQLACNLFVATGKAKINFWVAISITITRVTVMVFTVQYGLTVMILSFVPVAIFRFVLLQYLVNRYYGVKFRHVIKTLLLNGFITSCALVVPAYYWATGTVELDSMQLIIPLLIAVAISSATVLLLTFATKHPLSSEIESAAKFVGVKLAATTQRFIKR